MLGAALRRSSPMVTKTATRNMSVIATPPVNKVGIGEMIALGATFGVCVLAYPAWVLTHIKAYKGRPDE